MGTLYAHTSFGRRHILHGKIKIFSVGTFQDMVEIYRFFIFQIKQFFRSKKSVLHGNLFQRPPQCGPSFFRNNLWAD